MSEHPGERDDDGPGDSGAIEIRDQPEAERFELWVGGTYGGRLDYHVHGRVFTAIHTELEPWLSGRGLGSVLVRDVLAVVRRRGLRLQPRCPFVAGYVSRHPEEADVVGGVEERNR